MGYVLLQEEQASEKDTRKYSSVLITQWLCCVVFMSGNAAVRWLMNVFQSVLHGIPGKEVEPEAPDKQLHFVLCCNIK